METGTIEVASLAGGIDLQATLESGQSCFWDRADGRMYDDLASRAGRRGTPPCSRRISPATTR